tara:strand:- start:136 stop:972 length:837 start_codon:yes stop_codon:yes gene_type:complete
MKYFNRLLISCILTFLLFFKINSQQKIDTFSNGKPIEIFADNGIEWHKNEKKYIAKGNARAIQDDFVVTSDLLEAYYAEENNSETKIILLKAKGNVIINNKSAKISGGKIGIFDVRKDYFKINGSNLVMVSQDDQLKAKKKIEFWRKENIAIATGKAVARKENKYILRAHRLAWYLDRNKKTADEDFTIKKIIGFKNVEIENDNEIAFSDKALYNNIKEECKLFGNVRIKRGENFLTGDIAVINMKTGVSKLLPNKFNGINKTEERVKALISKDNTDD